MNVWDSELLTRKNKDAQMITDGLIMWIDGRDAPGTKQISERVTSTTITGGNGNYTTTQSQDGLFLVVATTGSVNTGFTFNGASALTVEYVSSPLSLYGYAIDDGSGGMMYVSRNYTEAPLIRCTYKHKNSGSNVMAYPSAYPQQFVITPNAYFFNGVKTTDPTDIRTAFTSGLRINAWSARDQYVGAIRAYNRVLSDDEILQNLEYEKSIGRIVL